MSLISIRSFAAPFTNKVHLVTIIVVAMLFTVYRLSGGGAEIVNKSEVKKLRATSEVELPDTASSFSLRDEEAVPQEMAQPRKQLTEPADDLDKKIMNSRSPEQAAQETKPSKDDSLADIERSLGLR